VVISYTLLSIAVGLTAGLFEGFVLLATAATIFSLVVHIITNSTVWRIYKGKERRVLIHFVLPAVASALFLFIIYATVYPFSLPISYAPLSVLVWAIISVVLVIYVRARKREQYNKAGLYSSVE